MSTEEPSAVVATEKESVNMLAVIARAVSEHPEMDVDKMERLLAMHERITEQQRKIAFMEAMARVAPKLPQIEQNGRISYATKSGGQMETKYAQLEDIDRIIRPIISEEGLSQSYDTETTADGKIKIICKLSHAQGHFELKSITLSVDKSGSKNDAQAVKSTISYGRRILTEMHFNLIEKGLDTDAVNPETITEEQAKDIAAMITEVKANAVKFLEYMHVDSLEAILARDYKKAIVALETKRKAQK